MQTRLGKYGARKTKVDGILFDSQAEANYYQNLLLLQRAGEVTKIQRQPEYVLQPPFLSKHTRKIVRGIKYRADFLVTYKDGREEIIDVKGHKTKEYLLKKKLFEFKYPDLQIVEVEA
jgi:hypothetical protein